MYKYILEQAGDINWMAVFALLTFVFIFSTSLILVFKHNKQYTDHMAHLPLEDGLVEPQNTANYDK